MQFFSFCLFTLICGYSLVISAPVSQTAPNSQDIKHQQATAIASRLLKELAGEQSASHHQEQSSNTDENKNENKDTIVSVNHPATEKIEPHVSKQNDDIVDDDDDEDFEYVPTLEDLFEIYDDESSSEFNDDGYIPINKQQLMRYLAEQEESDEHLLPVIHTPVMDDSIMQAENHRRRRSIY